MIDLDSIKSKVLELQLDDEKVKSALKLEKKLLKEVHGDLSNSLEAQSIIQLIAQTMQQKAHKRISGLVSRCLSSVFSEPYEFRIVFDRKRGKTEARMEFERDGIVLDDPFNQIGGGVIDVAALALRLACIMMVQPRRRRLLVLDEPLKNVRGKQNRHRVRLLLETLAEEMDMQIILNVDIDSYPEFAVGDILEIGNN